MLSEDASKQLEKVWISLYDNGLTDEQVCQLAAKHNINNTGSQQTKMAGIRDNLERVVAPDEQQGRSHRRNTTEFNGLEEGVPNDVLGGRKSKLFFY